MKRYSGNFTLFLLGLLVAVVSVNAQDAGNKASTDSRLRGSGRVNASTLGMEISIPLGSYSGRGINIPISLSYSSKVWRPEYMSNSPVPGTSGYPCFPHYRMEFSETSASGWTSSMAVPYIEYIGTETIYGSDGKPYPDDTGCPPGGGGSPPGYFIKRLLVHLPSGETHELRANDTAESFTIGSSSGGPYDPLEWNATFYATDGSNLKYIQNSATGEYRLYLPDGSHYNFNTTYGAGGDRKAINYTDRNGNFTTYNGTYWTDTLGRDLVIPIGTEAPTSPTSDQAPVEYSLPGMTGTYKFHWKRLKDDSAAESGLTNFSDDLRYPGNTYNCQSGGGLPTYCNRSSGESLFYPDLYVAKIVADDLFNPIVLTKIELPTGESYRFTYDIYGRIERIIYPTGGEEEFAYEVIPTLSVLEPTDVVGGIANFGVAERRVLKSSSDTTPYEWNYEAEYVNPSGYVVRTENPDGTMTERFLFRADPACSQCDLGSFGYDNALAGMVYETRSFDSSETLVSRTLTHWSKTTLTSTSPSVSGDWHPRVDHVESLTYDPGGSGDVLSSTVKYEYEGDLNQRSTPVLMNKATQYAFVAASGGSLAPLPEPGESPVPNPTPVPTPVPPTPTKIVETTYLINDANINGAIRDAYKARHMIGLVTASAVKDGAGTVVSRSETVYDDISNYPLTSPGTPSSGWSDPSTNYRGNPNTLRVWDSTKGAYTNSAAYISTHAQFDKFGNQVKTWDANGNLTQTDYSSTYAYAYPTSVTTAVPDPTGTHGSSTAFTTEATFNATTGLPLTTTDANGLKTEITYDTVTLRPLNTKNYVGSTQVGGTSETIYHDEPGNFWVKNRSQIDETNWAESITYFDGLGRAFKSERIHSDGNIFVEKEFDAEGRVKRVSNPFRSGETKQWTTNVYDDASRVVEVVLPDGAKVKTDYAVSVTGTVGITKQITDQAGMKRKGITDAQGRMVRVIEDPDGQNLNTDYVFDTLGNLRKTIQGEQSRYFMHDSLGRLLYAKQPEQEANTGFTATDPITSNTAWSVKYEYDDNGNITKTMDAEGIYVQGTYDALNRITVRNYSDSTPDVDFYYDGKYLDENDYPHTATGSINGKTTGIRSAVSKTNYPSFDVFGRTLSHQQITDGEIYTTGYEYNLSGALIEETYPSGRKVKSVLNGDGELAVLQSRQDDNHGYWNYAGNFSYDTNGAVTKMRLGNFRWETAEYNNRSQITQIGLGTTDDAQDLLKLELDYGSSTQNNGSLREQTITVPTVGSNPGFTAVQAYEYDGLNRLQSAEESVASTQTWKQTFSYDRYGNRRFNTTSGNTTTLGSCPEAVCNPTIDTADNRFVTDQNSDSVDEYAYDKNGNLTLDAEGRQFVYDAENHQTEVKDGQSNTVGEYEYDGEGRRVKKITAAETTVFVYNAGGQLVAEYSTQTAQEPRVSYLTTDHLGSPRVVTDENGTVVDRKDYTAFGEESYTPERVAGLGYSAADELRKGYTGYEKDGESGLDFAQARYYKATHGRFTSVDPLTASASIRNPQTFNRYAYVLNNPMNLADPTGLIWLRKVGTESYLWVNDIEYEKNKDSYEGWVESNFVIIRVTSVAAGEDESLVGQQVMLLGNGEMSPITDDEIERGTVDGGVDRDPMLEVIEASESVLWWGRPFVYAMTGPVCLPAALPWATAAGGSGAGGGLLSLGLSETATGVGTTLTTVAAANPERTTQWIFGTFKSAAKWANQLQSRGWTTKQISEAITQGKSFPAENLINKANGATRFVHPTTGKSVVIDNVTKEILHVGGNGFKY